MRLLFISIFFLILLTCCKSQQDYINTVSFEPVKTFRIMMPINEGSFSYPRCIQVTDSFIVVYYYSKDSLFIYDSKSCELIYRVPVDYHSLHGLFFINNDSIWVFGETKKGHKHPFYLIDVHGNVKKKIDVRDYVKTEDIKDFVQVGDNNFIYDNKLFFSLYYYQEDGKNIHYRKHSIIGYYDLLKDSVVFNDKLYFPYIKDGIYYPINDYYMRYCPFFTINDKKDEIIISFSYTPSYYVWNFKTNQVKLFNNAKSVLMDTIMPYNRPINRNDPEFYPYSKTIGIFSEINYLKGQDVYLRHLKLPEDAYGQENNVLAFMDGEKKYLGEVSSDNLTIENSKIFFREWNNDSLVLAYNSKKNKLNIYLGRLKFIPVKQINYINKMKSKAKKSKEKEEYEVCRIIGNKQNIEKKDVLLYLKEKHNINDSTFSAIIMNSQGCPGCNNYILNNFLNINKSVFFNMEQNPFYLVYVDKNESRALIKNNVLSEFVNFEQKVKIDTTTLYEKFNPSNSFNPRLILVRQNKILSDSVYMPANLHNLVEKLIEFYNFTTN